MTELALGIRHRRTSGRVWRRGLLLAVLLAAFGPYVSMDLGVRTDHFAVYGLALLAVVAAGSGRRELALPRTLWAVGGLLLAATAWTLLVSYFARPASGAEIAAATENYVQPVALLAGVGVLVAMGPPAERRPLLRRAIIVGCVLLTANTVLAVASIFVDTWPLARWFVREASYTGRSVWENAVNLGRYSGIFDQPMESGVAYSTALLGWIYAVGSEGRPSSRDLVLLVGILVGGFLSVSKIFILGGVPLAGLYLVRTLRWSPRRIARYLLGTLAFLAVFVPAAAWLMNRWIGQKFFLRLFDADTISRQGLLTLYSAGRFGGGETTVERLFATAWRDAPVQGFGFASFSPLDNAYLQFFYQGGLVALVLYLAVLLVLVGHAWLRRRSAPEEARLLMVLTVLVAGAGIGAPVLTLNRSSVLLWVLLVLAVTASTSGAGVPTRDR